MYRPSSLAVVAGLYGGTLTLVPVSPATLTAQDDSAEQERVVVASEVELSPTTASLFLEFASGDELSALFFEGVATLDGQVLGNYQMGGETDDAWRTLLADVVLLPEGEIAEELARWNPEVQSPTAERDIVAALLDALGPVTGANAVATASDAPEDAANPQTQSVDQARADPRLQILLELAKTEHLTGLAQGLEELDLESLHIVINSDLVIPANESRNNDFLVVDGKLEVRGRVRGDVVVVNGDLTLAQGGRLDGDVKLVDSQVENHGDALQGEVMDMEREAERTEDRLRAELRRELLHDNRGSAFWRRLKWVGENIGRTVISFLVLGVGTLLLMKLAGPRLDLVTRTVSDYPGRAAAVGFAGGFLLLPAYILGIVVLAVTLIGIPFLLIWLPLFPIAAGVAAFAGFIAVSHHVGSWILEREFSWLNWANPHSDAHRKLIGTAAFLAPCVAAALLSIVRGFGWLGDLVTGLATLATIAAVFVGLGAVIMTRGGDRPVTPRGFVPTEPPEPENEVAP